MKTFKISIEVEWSAESKADAERDLLEEVVIDSILWRTVGYQIVEVNPGEEVFVSRKENHERS